MQLRREGLRYHAGGRGGKGLGTWRERAAPEPPAAGKKVARPCPWATREDMLNFGTLGLRLVISLIRAVPVATWDCPCKVEFGWKVSGF